MIRITIRMTKMIRRIAKLAIRVCKRTRVKNRPTII